MIVLLGMSWPRRGRLVRSLGRAIAGVVLLSLMTSCCGSSKKAVSSSSEFRAESSESVVKSDSVVVALRDTLREVTTVTVQLGAAGDTVFRSVVTDRTNARSRDNRAAVRTNVVERHDTVYVERRDSMSVEIPGRARNELAKGSGFVAGLRWVFWIVVGLIVLVVVIRVKRG